MTDTKECEVEDYVYSLAKALAEGARESAKEMGIDVGKAVANNIYYFEFEDGTASRFWLAAAESAVNAVQSGNVEIPSKE